VFISIHLDALIYAELFIPLFQFHANEFFNHFELDHRTKLFSHAKLFFHHRIIHKLLALFSDHHTIIQLVQFILFLYHHKIVHHVLDVFSDHHMIVQLFHSILFLYHHHIHPLPLLIVFSDQPQMNGRFVESPLPSISIFKFVHHELTFISTGLL
jgi:hypothetical protein